MQDCGQIEPCSAPVTAVKSSESLKTVFSEVGLKINIKHRNAFTITELVIVIAVVAILAAILIPTFSNVLNSANRSADEQAVTQMNSILNAEHILNGELNVEEAKKILSESGFNVDSYIPLNKNHIFYFDETECKILIYDQSAGRVIYPSEIVDKYSNYSDGQKSMNWYILKCR